MKYYFKGVWIILLIKNLKLKPGKLISKFIGPFKILEYISKSIYKLEFPNLYNRLYLTFYISLLKEYIVKKEQDPELYPVGEFPEFADNNKE